MKRYEKYKDSGIQWAGEIPAHWKIPAVSHLFKIGRGRVIDNGEIIDNPGEYPVYSSQTFNNGELGKISTFDFEGDYLTWTTDGANAGTVFRRTGKFNCTNVCGTLLLKSPDEHNLNFLKYALDFMTDQYVRKDINPKLMNDVMSRIKIFSPPLAEQIKIANYLDRKTAKIDVVIQKKKALIENLKQYRQSLITETVTKGLNQNVSMKDSGVEWIGEIPAHWTVTKLKNIVDVKDGTHDTPNPVEEGNNTFPLITSRNLENGEINFDKSYHINEKDFIKINKRSNVEFGDIIMPMIGTIGNPTVVKTNKKFSIKNVALFKTSKNNQLKQIINFFLKSELFSKQVDLLKSGGVQSFISLGNIRNLFFIQMPAEEQKEIVDFLKSNIGKIESTINNYSTQINLLNQYRQSLISEVVTGKIKID